MEEVLAQIRERKLVVGGLLGLVALVFIYLSFLQTDKPSESELLNSASSSLVSQSTAQEDYPSSSKEEADLVVDVKGAVQKEGVYQLPAGSRVDDAIRLAGGLTETADKKSINLAQKLSDGSVVYVASQGENISVISTSSATNPSDTSGVGTGKVNINRASVSELQTISGIGAKRAQDIIDYRESSGFFKSVEDLQKVSGIGQKTFDKIKEMITVD